MIPDQIVQQNLTTGFTPETAWEQLRHDIPHLFEHATFNYSDPLQPNLTIIAEVERSEIDVTVRFEVKDHGHIRFENSRIANMTPSPGIHAHFARLDPRIPPCAQCADVDDRPHYPETPINFTLQKGIDISDSAANGPGALGGDNGHGVVLPPIIYSPAPIDVSKGKISCGMTGIPGPHDSDSADSCPTDSSADIPGEDTHKLIQIAQAIHKQEPVTVCLKGHFKGYQDVESVVHFQRDHVGPPPTSLHELFQKAFSEIAASSPLYVSSGVPGSLFWTIVPFAQESLEITVVKIGKGLIVTFAPKNLKGVPITDCPAAYVLELAGEWFTSRLLRDIKISCNSVAMGDSALSIRFPMSDLSLTHAILEYDTGDQLLSLEGAPPSIRCLTCVHNTGTHNGIDSPHGLICTGRTVQLTDCVFLHDQFDAFVTSWEEGVAITLIGCVFTSGTLVAGADPMRIETTNCTIQEDGEAVIDSGFCPTIIQRTATPTEYFTPPLNYKYLPRFDVIRFGLFLFAMEDFM